jgi:drug/metabolite transporter (DMT)-like permease
MAKWLSSKRTCCQYAPLMNHQRPQDSNAKAVAFLMFGITAGLGLDIVAKWLLASYSLPQFVFLRSIFGLLVFLIIAQPMGGLGQLATRRWRWHLLRTLLASGAMLGFFYALSKIPLVSTLTLAFTAPLMVTALSAGFLGEPIGWRRWLAVLVGFGGVLIILRPGSGLLTQAGLIVIAAAFLYACLVITARKLADTESSLALSVYVILGPLLISSLFVTEHWRTPTAGDWGLFALAGLCSASAWVGIVGGYRRASPALLAPLEYTPLIGAAIAGYLIWGEVPDRWVIAGGLVIICSGLFVVYRDLGAVLSGRNLRALTASGAAAIARRVYRKNRQR